MSRYLDPQAAPFDFDELANHLLDQGAECSPSELHGCLCGLLAAGAPGEAEAGLALACQALGLEIHGELAGLVLDLYAVSAAALEDEEFDFHPLLPDDDTELETRTRALAGWVRGFLSGYARVNQSQPTRDSGEILGDFAAIAEACVDEGDGDDEAEGSYLELVEYLRFAALNVFMDSRAAHAGRGGPAVH